MSFLRATRQRHEQRFSFKDIIFVGLTTVEETSVLLNTCASTSLKRKLVSAADRSRSPPMKLSGDYEQANATESLDAASQGETWPPKCLAHFVILCFESGCPKQNTVARLKSNDLPLPKLLGWLRHCCKRAGWKRKCLSAVPNRLSHFLRAKSEFTLAHRFEAYFEKSMLLLTTETSKATSLKSTAYRVYGVDTDVRARFVSGSRFAHATHTYQKKLDATEAHMLRSGNDYLNSSLIRNIFQNHTQQANQSYLRTSFSL